MANDAKPGVLDRRGEALHAREEALLNDRLDIASVESPQFASPGQTVRIEVTVIGRAPIGTDAEGAVRFTRTDTGESVRQPSSGVRGIAPGERVTFSYTFSMPDNDVVVEIEALERDVGTTGVTDTDTVRVSSSGVAGVLNPVTDFGPWLLAGGGVGVGAARLTGRRDRQVAAGALGAGVGLGARALAAREGPVLPEFPTTAVLATAGLLGAGAIFLQVSGVADVTQGLGSAAGRLRA